MGGTLIGNAHPNGIPVFAVRAENVEIVVPRFSTYCSAALNAPSRAVATSFHGVSLCRWKNM